MEKKKYRKTADPPVRAIEKKSGNTWEVDTNEKKGEKAEEKAGTPGSLKKPRETSGAAREVNC